MSNKLPELSGASDLGDIDDILHDQSVSDLSWLDVDIDEYRAYEALPKQNLDWIPEVTKALMEDERDPRVPMRIPLRRKTMVNSNPLESPRAPTRSSRASVLNRTAAYVMAGLNPSQVRLRLASEFGLGDLQAAQADIESVFSESGVLGNVYVNASHFPRCAQVGAHREFVAKHGKRALFVLSKPDCVGCVHNVGGRCSSFKKRIVDQIPYDEETYAHYLPQLVSEHRASAADAPPSPGALQMSDQERKERLRAAFTRVPVLPRPNPVQTIRHQAKPAKPAITEQDIQDFWRRKSSAGSVEPMPSSIYLTAAKRIMLGTADARLLIASLDPEVRKLALEHGLLGHTYLDGDALGGPRAALDLISSRNLSPDFVLFRKTYSDQISVDALPKLFQLTEVTSIRPTIGRDAFVQACSRAYKDGRMSAEQMRAAIKNAKDGSPWARLVSQANLYVPPIATPEVAASSAPRGSFYYGDTSESRNSSMNPDEVRRTIAHMMNTGLYGKALRSAILARYARSDLAQVPEVGHSLAVDDGVQGFYFVDPTIYRDYGKGCSDGSKLFRKQGADRVLAGPSCTGCMYQTAPSWCNKYAKQIIRQIPDEERRQAAERRSLPLAPSSQAPVTNPVDEYGLSAELSVDLSGSKAKDIEIVIASAEVSG